jgi:catechol 2,3-dioxygenase-like lactoylglutathione lyase family enzyme
MDRKLKRINVVVLFASDVDRTKAFYQNTLGLPLHGEDEASAMFDFDGTLLILLSTASAQDLLSTDAVATSPPSGARSQLVSFVDDVDEVYAELAAKGVEFVRTPIDRPWGLRTAHFKDPEGNIWEIAQPVASGQDEG